MYVCKADRLTFLIQVDASGKETANTKRCLNDEICLPAAAGPNAVCGTGNEAFCVPDGTFDCACPAPSPVAYGCDPRGSASGPDETKLFPLDGCGFLRETETPVICQVGDPCWYTWNADGSVNERAGAHCASSMAEAQRGSSFYQYACDEELYMHATTGLEMDCR